ncbi:hypothetical protein T4D_12899 [Trichinella pseudospiralis]|uniref:Uncharacterized protein n=1 Tax=Trichinella pseudospiralis TaxID=6337 RepID=A0A0V1FLT0_TRIPS|nr:hypothetical protein T4D_12899 [Trichinella pseudospiralis]
MPSLKREAERRGKAAANTRPSTNSGGRANSLAEETDEPACGSGSRGILHRTHLIVCQRIFRKTRETTFDNFSPTDQIIPEWVVTSPPLDAM